MNQVYRIVWNAALGMFQVVSELAHAHGGKSGRSDRRKSRRHTLHAAAALTLAASSPLALAQFTVNGGTPGTDYTVDGSGNVDVTGVISATQAGINATGSAGTLTNSGLINNGFFAITNAGTGTISLIHNQAGGTLSGGQSILSNGGTIGTLLNSGLIGGGSAGLGLSNYGYIGTVSNDGSLTGLFTGIYNSNSGTISVIQNLSGGVISNAVGPGGGSGTTGAGIYNSGNIGTLSNSGTITSVGVGLYGIFNDSISSVSVLSNQSGGVISGPSIGISNLGSIGTLSNSGSISGSIYGINNQSGGTITSLTNQSGGVISATRSSGLNAGVINSGMMSMLTNSGSIISGSSIAGTTSGYFGIVNAGGGTISSLTNTSSGFIHANSTGVVNLGGIGTLANSGTISGDSRGIYIDSTGSIGTLTNSGTILGSAYGIDNLGTIGVLENVSGGIISGGAIGIVNNGSITAISNSGTISGPSYALMNYGTIGTLSNSGVITSNGQSNLRTTGSIGTLSNSGTISGSSYALVNSGTIGTLINAGLISGHVTNASSSDLNLQGGSGTTFGTFTGPGGSMGFFNNQSSNINLSGGNILLNDNVDLGGTFALNNTGTGVLQVNDQISITGNYNQGANATLQIGVSSSAVTNGTSSDTGYGRLVVSGAATVDSGSSVKLTSTGAGYGFAAGQRYLVIQGGGGSSYGGVTAQGGVSTLNYSIANYTSSISGNAVTDGSGLDLVLTVNSAAPIGSNATAPNAVAAINALSGYTGLDPTLINLQNAAAFARSGGSADANRIGKQLAPSVGNPGSVASAPTLDAMNVVGSHLQAQQTAQADVGTGLATGDAPLDWMAWGQAFGGRAHQSERSNVDGYTANYGGLLLGADRAYGNAWRVGGAFSFSNTSATNAGDTAGNKTRVNGYGLIGYAGYLGEPWFVNLSAAVVQQQFDTTRLIDMTGFSGTVNGKFNGMQYVARAEAGYPLRLKDGYTVTPLGNLTYSYQQQNAYAESGGNGAALSVGASHANSVKSGLGAKIEKAYTTAYGDLIPSLQAQWVHEYVNTRQTTTASFLADPSGQTAFSTMAASPVTDMADISVGVALLKANNLSISARYAIQAAHGFVAQTGIIRLQQRF
ncbi:MAG TPA: autotransporter domain-containing protein [Rhodocyclaceae bacterium]|nr:autotransporter domain-containing protein [Rhodocyclaceae bacterium]